MPAIAREATQPTGFRAAWRIKRYGPFSLIKGSQLNVILGPANLRAKSIARIGYTWVQAQFLFAHAKAVIAYVGETLFAGLPISLF